MECPVLGTLVKEDEISGMRAAGCFWIIDGRPLLVPSKAPEVAEKESTTGMTEIKTVDTGDSGDLYQVHLQVTGKWRRVWWEKLPATNMLTSGMEKYYIGGGFNDWRLEEMTKDPETGAFSFDVLLNDAAQRGMNQYSEFQIVFNKDWDQAFHPGQNWSGPGADIFGPDDQGWGLNWVMNGKRGDTYRVKFQWSQEPGADMKMISWQKVTN